MQKKKTAYLNRPKYYNKEIKLYFKKIPLRKALVYMTCEF